MESSPSTEPSQKAKQLLGINGVCQSVENFYKISILFFKSKLKNIKNIFAAKCLDDVAHNQDFRNCSCEPRCK